MFRLVLAILFLFCNAYSLWTVSYGGMEVHCPWYCGDPFDDPNMKNIAFLFETCLEKTLNSRFFTSEFRWEKEDSHIWIPTFQDDDEYSKWQEASIETHEDFLKTTTAFRKALFLSTQYLSSFQEEEIAKDQKNLSLLEEWKGMDTLVHYDDEGIFKKGSLLSDIWRGYPIPEAFEVTQERLHRNEELLRNKKEFYEDSLALAEEAFREIDALFKHIFTWCLKNHQPEGIAFRESLEYFLQEDLYEALDRIRSLIELLEKQDYSSEWIAKLLFLQGQLQSEFRLYGESITALTQAIQKNPSCKEIYLERAFAHFELGNFDLALQDYLAFGSKEQRGLLESEYLEFALSFQKGIKDGLITGCLDFIPSMLHSLKGVANGIWAVATDPIETPRQTILSALEFCSFLSRASFSEITGTLAPETHSLVLDWNQLNHSEQGERLGNLIGSFGIDILQVFAINKGAKVFTAYQKLKNANKLAALESLSKDAKKTIAACETFAQNRQKLLSKLKIGRDDQGKHMKGRHNYEPGRSIFEHKDPQNLLEKFAGSGRKVGHAEIGNPGYKEKVNFGEYIGKCVDKDTGIETSTTWGMIHYSKTSAHIIPVLPDPPL